MTAGIITLILRPSRCSYSNRNPHSASRSEISRVHTRSFSSLTYTACGFSSKTNTISAGIWPGVSSPNLPIIRSLHSDCRNVTRFPRFHPGFTSNSTIFSTGVTSPLDETVLRRIFIFFRVPKYLHRILIEGTQFLQGTIKRTRDRRVDDWLFPFFHTPRNRGNRRNRGDRPRGGRVVQKGETLGVARMEEEPRGYLMEAAWRKSQVPKKRLKMSKGSGCVNM